MANTAKLDARAKVPAHCEQPPACLESDDYRSFAKPRETIQVLDHDLTGYDRKLFNVLLHLSQDYLKSDPYRTFEAMASTLREDVGQPGKHGNAPIKESLKRLQKTLVKLDYFNQGRLRERHLSLLITTDVPKNEGVVFWKFHPELVPLLANPQSYARVYLSVSALMRGGYAPRLYDQIALWATERKSTEEISVSDLRALMNATAESYDDFRSFNGKVLRPAVAQINNAKTPYHVRIDYARKGDGRQVTHIIFQIQKRGDWEPPVKALASPQMTGSQITGPEMAATQTASLFEPQAAGRGRAEVGHEPTEDEIRRLQRRIKEATLEQLKALYPALDVDATVREWAAMNIRSGRAVRRPKDEVVRYFDAYYGPLKHKAPDEVGQDDARPSDEMREALQVIGDMNVRQRRGWLAVACSANPDIEVPDLSCEHFMTWVPLILDTLRMHGMIGDVRGHTPQQRQQQEADIMP